MVSKLNQMRRGGRQDRSRLGFTLIELLLVLAILVVLASMVVTMFGGTQERALKDAAKGQVGIFKSGVNLYKFHTRNFPSDLNGLVESRAMRLSRIVGKARTSMPARCRSILGITTTSSSRRQA